MITNPINPNFGFEEIFDGGSGDVGGDTGGTGGSIELDTTLTEEGKAADAKAVGDALANKADKKDIVTIDSSLRKQGQAADALATGSLLRDLENLYEEHEANDLHHQLDKTLTKENQAADAKAVGDWCGELEIRADDAYDEIVKLKGEVDKIKAEQPETASVTTLQTPITYSELKTLRDNAQLISGMFYRITDYVCTTAQADTRAMDNKFDIIVQALSENTLSENASADYNEGDSYFQDTNLPAWELKYCLDNDTTRFAWAMDGMNAIIRVSGYDLIEPAVRAPEYDGQEEDGSEYQIAWRFTYGDGINIFEHAVYSLTEFVNVGDVLYHGGEIIEVLEVANQNNACGKGVIYYMKDEYGNECPYDFKNIQFKRYMITETDVDSISDWVGHYWGVTNGNNYTVNEDDYKWCYTFSWLNENDEIEDLSIVGHTLQNDEGQYDGIYNNVINTVSAYNKFYPENPQSYTIALNDIVFLSEWGYDDGAFYGCGSNTFGNNCHNNTFGNNCHNNTLGNGFYYNTFGNNCYYNTFGNCCVFNTLGNGCESNTFGNNCSNNTFGNGCYYNTLGNDCYCNTFGNGCYYNTFGNCCGFNNINGENIRYIEVGSGINNAAITPEPNADYQQIYRKSGSKEILI